MLVSARIAQVTYLQMSIFHLHTYKMCMCVHTNGTQFQKYMYICVCHTLLLRTYLKHMTIYTLSILRTLLHTYVLCIDTLTKHVHGLA